MSGRDRGEIARDALLVAAAAVVLYLAAGASGFGFVNYDDDAVVQGNPVQSWGTLGHAFTERMAHAWLPLYALSLGIDNILFGPGRPGAYHVHSVLLHALNAALVLVLARRLGLGRGAALLAGALFAIHPAVSESVAWVASRKDLLSFALAAGAALVFLGAEEEPRRPARHALGALLLGLGMLAKGTVVVVPALLALAVVGRETDPARRRRGLLATLPYFAVAAGLAVVHYGVAAAEGTAGANLGAGDTTGARLVAAAAAMGRYLFTLIWPFSLGVEHGIGPGTAYAGESLLLGGFFVLCLAFVFRVLVKGIRRGTTGGAVGILLVAILVSLAPFNGIFPRTSVMYAERYLYLPVALACGLVGCLAPSPGKGTMFQRAGPAFLLVGFAGFAFLHLPVWKDSLTLWDHAVRVAPSSPLARAKHGEALADAALSARDPKERTDLFQAAAGEQRLAAEHARSPLEEMRARQDAGVALLGAGKPEEALAELEKSRALLGRAGESMTASFRAGLEVNRAKALESCGRAREAEAALAETVRGDPGSAAAWTNLGVLRMRAGNYDGAREALLHATKADPDLVPARLAMADLEEIGGDFETALRIAVKATESAPRDAAALSKAGEIAFLLGQPVKSADWYRRALAVQEGDPVARRGLARGLAFMARTEMDRGKGPEALRLATEATEADPDSQDGWFALGDGRHSMGDATGALEAYYRAGKAGGGKRAADSRAAIYALRAVAVRGMGDAAGARELLEKALAEGPSEIRLGGKNPPVKEGLDRIPPPPAGGKARAPLLDGVLALAAGETGAALSAFDAVVKKTGFGSVTPPAEGPDDLRPAALVLRSRARIAADDLDGSVSDLDTLCRESGKEPGADARARFLLGHTLAARAARRRAEGKKEEAGADSARARAVLEEARRIDPSLLEASLALAEMHFVEGRSVEAIRELNGVLAKDPDRVEAHLVLGNIMKAQFVETRDRTFRDQGEEHFRRALSADPGEARALAGLGEMEAFSNRPREAMNFALRALAVDPDLPAARALAATLYLRGGRGRLDGGDADGALEAAKKADALGGETAALCLLRSDAFRKKGDWRTAGAEVERARTLSPGDPEVKDAVATHYRDICYAFLLSRRRDQAEEALRRAEAAGSTRVDLAEVRRLLDHGPGGVGGEALPPVDPALAAALEKAAGDARRLAEEGAALFRDGKAAAAAERFQASLGAYETAFGRFGLGLSLSAAGDAASAERDYRQATEDDPAYADAWLNLGALLFRRGADAEAEKAYAAYLDHAPKDGAEETVLRVKALLEEIRSHREKAPAPGEKPPAKAGK